MPIIRHYSYGDNAAYIPVILNLMHTKRDYIMQNNSYASKDFLDSLALNIDNLETGFIILDFTDIDLVDSRSFSTYQSIISKENRDILFCGVNETIYSFIEADCHGVVVGIPDRHIISTRRGLSFFEQNLDKFDVRIAQFYSLIVRNYLEKTAIEDEILLESSNVFANKYIDVKRICASPDIYNLVLLRLSKMITNRYPVSDYDGIVCASLNGAVLATLVGYMIGKNVLYLMNLGPRFTIRDKEVINNIPQGKKYIFVADMICTGTELKLAEMVISLRDSKIIGGVAVVKYLNPISYVNLSAIVDISDGDNFNYRLTVRKENN